MSNRIQKVNELIKREVGATLRRELEMPPGVLLTITRANTEADMKTVKIFIRVYPEDHSAGALDYLRKNTRALQHIVNRRLQMKFVPELSFYLDKEKNEAEEAEYEVEKILDSLK